MLDRQNKGQATDIDLRNLRETMKIAEESRAAGNHPFGVLLAGPDGAVLLISDNTFKDDKGASHAEMNLARDAAKAYSPEFLAECTLVTSVEPCRMCAGGTYWAGIGRLVYGMTEKHLAELTGDNPENLTMDMPCEHIFDAGQRRVAVVGPVPTLEGEIAKAHEGFW
ncbi:MULTISPECIES: nucleoside deaminase [unclassified Shinella]|uniref:nucleoside deaminase n=1 Tax=unclassified Shinella TaxID=2643062 RepID=UPI00225CD3F8|nr:MULTISPECIES: nucleoside deaminase [unclassified Shinella]MCO5139040.1 nucleoside deaminase [Shinella sp.]MDC7256231.1 nucleoside deaminase [Shinella sp. YE25]CAI0339085.1 cytidine/deoxycytidylate deaminase family protein [Rhizobiaceae bacterium]CAK7257504.1 Nucleoside deaminase [Shinella sp. WSC3-e]